MSDQTLEQKIAEATASLTSVLEPIKLAHAKLLVMNSELAELRRQRDEAQDRLAAILGKIEESPNGLTISREALHVLVRAANSYLELDYERGTSASLKLTPPEK